ncbi:hypothetical protein ACFL6I_10105 [candidate division KSB1 bacterium]
MGKTTIALQPLHLFLIESAKRLGTDDDTLFGQMLTDNYTAEKRLRRDRFHNVMILFARSEMHAVENVVSALTQIADFLECRETFWFQAYINMIWAQKHAHEHSRVMPELRSVDETALMLLEHAKEDPGDFPGTRIDSIIAISFPMLYSTIPGLEHEKKVLVVCRNMLLDLNLQRNTMVETAIELLNSRIHHEGIMTHMPVGGGGKLDAA